jgi:putative hydrolase of the HAD superfamily
MAKLRGLLLDLDNTLYPYDPAHAAAQAHTHPWLASQLGVPLETLQAAYATGRQQVHHQLHHTASSHNRLLYYQLALEHLGVAPFPLALQAYRRYWGAFCAAMQPFAGMYDALHRWHAQGLRLCLLTDLTADVQHQKIAALRLWPWLHALVTSEEVGAEKPDARMFTTALHKLQLGPEDVVMLGDNYDKDILGAVDAGIRAGWKTDTPAETPLPQGVFTWQHFEDLNL